MHKSPASQQPASSRNNLQEHQNAWGSFNTFVDNPAPNRCPTDDVKDKQVAQLFPTRPVSRHIHPSLKPAYRHALTQASKPLTTTTGVPTPSKATPSNPKHQTRTTSRPSHVSEQPMALAAFPPPAMENAIFQADLEDVAGKVRAAEAAREESIFNRLLKSIELVEEKVEEIENEKEEMPSPVKIPE